MALTPNMQMDLPVVGVTVDPTWAQKLNTAVGVVIDQHNHTSGEGQKIPTAALLIDNDLELNHFNLGTVNSVSLDNQLSSPPLALGQPNGVLLRFAGDLWWQNSASVAVKITNGSSINLGAVATNVFNLANIGVSGTISPTDPYTYINFDSSGGPIDVNLPAANAVTAGRYYIFKDATGFAATNNISAIPAGTDTIDNVSTPRDIAQNFGSFFLISNGIDGWTLFRDGPLPATTTSLGTVQIAGDIAGPGSIATSPKVVLATGTTGGLVTLAGDLAGPSSTSVLPTVVRATNSTDGLITIAGDLVGTHDLPLVSTITGVAGAASVVAGTTLTVPSTSGLTLASGSTLTVDGTVAVAATVSGTLATTLATTGTLSLAGTTTIPSGGILDVATGANQTVEGELSILTGGELFVQSGAEVVMNVDGGAGGQINFTGGGTLNMTGGSLGGTGNLNIGGGSVINVTGGASLIYLQSGAKLTQKTPGFADAPSLLPIFISSAFASTQTFTATTFQSISGTTLTCNNTMAGDIVVLNITYAWRTSTNAVTSTFRCAATDGGVPVSGIPDNLVASNNTSSTFTNYSSLVISKVVVNGGIYSAGLFTTNGTATSLTINPNQGATVIQMSVYR